MTDRDFVGLPAQMSVALQAAQLYYQQDQTMETIARELNMSRSSVSRLLSHARKIGLVDIQVRSPLDRSSRLRHIFHTRFGVAAHTVSVPDHASESERSDRVSLAAARMLSTFIESNMIVGVAWGATASTISRHLVPQSVHNTKFVQLSGAGNSTSSGITSASEMLGRFGTAYSAHIEYFPVPAFFDSAATKDAVWLERSTVRVLDVQSRMDVAIFSVETPFATVPSQVFAEGALVPADYRSLAESGVVGAVATVFFRADGSSAGIPLNRRSTGPSFSVLNRASRRICIASGATKLTSLGGALSAGIITDLIVDERTAGMLADTTSEHVR